MDELTDAEAAFKLYSWLDSSGGDFSDVQNGLESVRHDRFTDEENHTFERICRYINHADDSLSEAMEQLDTVLTDESVEERNDTHVFTDSVSDRDIRTTQTLVSHALEDIGLCVNDLGVKPRGTLPHIL